MRFIKRLFKLVLLLALIVAVAAAVVFFRSRQRPDWYAHVGAVDPERAAEAARNAQNKLIATQQWAAGLEAAERRAAAGTAQVEPSTRPAESSRTTGRGFTVEFSEEELNAIFQKWKAQQGWDAVYSRYLSNPAIVLHEGRVILAGTVTELDRVVSLHFNPSVDAQSGRLKLDLESVMAGRLPMPQGLFESYRQRLRAKVDQQLPPQQRAARVTPDGAVNREAMAAAMGQMLSAVLNRQTAEPVLFLQGNAGRNVPVKVTDVRVEGDTIGFTVEMMTAQERQAWIERLRGPYDIATARRSNDPAARTRTQ
jgi:hypothetical protein